MPTSFFLTVGRLEVPVDDGDGGAVVEVGDAPGHLDGPVDEHVGPDLPAAEDAVERPAARELHHQAEVGLLQAHAHQAYDVLRERERETSRKVRVHPQICYPVCALHSTNCATIQEGFDLHN